uniref:Uncharacterized protein n=1 Tax=Arion vulgaris TaxID=1028688 RepID=A0A0B7BDR1_9EUPU
MQKSVRSGIPVVLTMPGFIAGEHKKKKSQYILSDCSVSLENPKCMVFSKNMLYIDFKWFILYP